MSLNEGARSGSITRAEPPRAAPSLIVTERRSATTWRVPIRQERLLIGRSPAADVQIDDPLVSREHCSIERQGNRVRIVDLASQNGTRVNGEPVRVRWLTTGDEIQLGNEVWIEYRDRPLDDAKSDPGETLLAPSPAPASSGASDDPAQVFRFFRDLLIFCTLDDATLKSVARQVRVRRFPAEAAIVREGVASESFYIIRSGYATSVEGEQTRRLAPGFCFGAFALLRSGSSTCTVTCETACEVYELTREQFLGLIQQNPSVAAHFTRILCSSSTLPIDPRSTFGAIPNSAPRVGIALAAGAARGLVALGALKVLEEEGIPIHMVAGCSIGALIGGAYAFTGSYAETYRMFRKFGGSARQVRKNFFDLALWPWQGLLKGDRMVKVFQDVLQDRDDFAACKIPFVAVATDLLQGREVVFDRGPLSQAVRASVSIPAAFRPVQIDGRLYVDGGLVNPLPVDVLAQRGMDVIIAVMAADARRDYVERGLFSHNLIRMLSESLSISMGQMSMMATRLADLSIAPEVSGLKWYEFHRLDEMVALGEAAARAQLDELKRLTRPAPPGHGAAAAQEGGLRGLSARPQ